MCAWLVPIVIFFCCTVSFKNFITSFLLAFLEFPPVRKCFRGLTFGTKQIKITVPENSFVLHFQLMPLTALDWKHITDSIFSNPFFLNKRNSCPENPRRFPFCTYAYIKCEFWICQPIPLYRQEYQRSKVKKNFKFSTPFFKFCNLKIEVAPKVIR